MPKSLPCFYLYVNDLLNQVQLALFCFFATPCLVDDGASGMSWLYAVIGAIILAAAAALAVGITCCIRRNRCVPNGSQATETPVRHDAGNDGLVYENTEDLNVAKGKEDDTEIYEDVSTPPAHVTNVWDLNARAPRHVTPVGEDIYENPTHYETPGPREPTFPNIYSKI